MKSLTFCYESKNLDTGRGFVLDFEEEEDLARSHPSHSDEPFAPVELDGFKDGMVVVAVHRDVFIWKDFSFLEKTFVRILEVRTERKLFIIITVSSCIAHRFRTAIRPFGLVLMIHRSFNEKSTGQAGALSFFPVWPSGMDPSKEQSVSA